MEFVSQHWGNITTPPPTHPPSFKLGFIITPHPFLSSWISFPPPDKKIDWNLSIYLSLLTWAYNLIIVKTISRSLNIFYLEIEWCNISFFKLYIQPSFSRSHQRVRKYLIHTLKKVKIMYNVAMDEIKQLKSIKIN